MPTFFNPSKVTVTESGGPTAAGLLAAASAAGAAYAAWNLRQAILTAALIILASLAVLAAAGLAILARKLARPEMPVSTRAQIDAAVDRMRATGRRRPFALPRPAGPRVLCVIAVRRPGAAAAPPTPSGTPMITATVTPVPGPWAQSDQGSDRGHVPGPGRPALYAIEGGEGK